MALAMSLVSTFREDAALSLMVGRSRLLNLPELFASDLDFPQRGRICGSCLQK
jgi:hypothetical protein